MTPAKKNPAAVALGAIGGRSGTGAAKARNVTSEMATRAVNARWANKPVAKSKTPWPW